MSGASARATARAHPNIALAKYWGKRAFGHNLPAVPSLSVTLAGMTTTTTVELDPALERDELRLGGRDGGDAATARVAALLDRVRRAASRREHARVTSDNDFPTASGLASSASAFAALACAASHAMGLRLDAAALSDLARRTSVSAARSALGGFVSLRAGEPGDETLSAEPVAPPDHWDLVVVVAVTHEGPKEIGSTEGMLRTAVESPLFPAWVDDAPLVFDRVRRAVLARDLEALGAASEASALRMHATALGADPGVVYFSGATIEVVRAVRAFRTRGLPAWFTIDAGPHVKVLTTARHQAEVVRRLGGVPGVLRCIATRPGPGAHVVEAPVGR